MNTTLITLRSENSKTGKMASIYRDKNSCPLSCPLLGICYASYGIGGSLFGKAKKYGSTDVGIFSRLSRIPNKGALRVNVSGDYFVQNKLDREYVSLLNKFAEERPDVSIISYTHAWKRLSPRLFSYVVNASVETVLSAKIALDKGWQVVIIDDGPLVGSLIDEHKVVMCPFYTHGLTCNECRLCARKRNAIIAFPVHGIGKDKMRKVLVELNGA